MISHYSQLPVVGSVSHSIAILCTVFRLTYRCWMRQFWWEDAWAAFALISDILCLTYIWVDTSANNWAPAVAFTCVLWAARMSVIFSIIRIGSPSGSKVHKKITYLIAASFACMWAALLAQKVNTCIYRACQMAEPVAISQLITDIVADISLVAAPLQFWKNVGLSHNRKILVLSAFGASLIITVITIPHSILLFHPMNQTTLIIAHVKAALSLVICNLLVIVTFAYRVCWKETFDLDQTFTASPGIFTSVVMAQFQINTNTDMSFSAQDEIPSRQTTPVPTGAMKTNMGRGSVIDIEEGTDIEGWPETLKDVKQ